MTLLQSLVVQTDLPKFQSSPSKASSSDAAAKLQALDETQGPAGPLPRFDDVLTAARKPVGPQVQERPAVAKKDAPKGETGASTEQPADHEAAASEGGHRGVNKNFKRTKPAAGQKQVQVQEEGDSAVSSSPLADTLSASVSDASLEAPPEPTGDSETAGATVVEPQKDAPVTAPMHGIPDFAAVLPQVVVNAVPTPDPAVAVVTPSNTTPPSTPATAPTPAAAATPSAINTLPEPTPAPTTAEASTSEAAPKSPTVPTTPAAKATPPAPPASTTTTANTVSATLDTPPDMPIEKASDKAKSKQPTERKPLEKSDSLLTATPELTGPPQQDNPRGQLQNGLTGQEKPAAFAPGNKHVTKDPVGESAAAPGPSNAAINLQPLQPGSGGTQSLQDVIVQAAKFMQTTASAPQEDKPAAPSPVTLTPHIATTPNLPSDGADAAAPAQQLPPTSSENTFDQVVLGLRGKLDAKNGKAEIRLDPPNLGTLHVSLSLSNGSLTAEFQSSSDLVRDLLKSNMEKLKSVLEGQGVAVDKLAVESPAPSPAAQAAKSPDAGSPNHDGRSAGNFGRDSNPGQRRSQDSGLFARMFKGEARSFADKPPIDVVA